MRTLNRNMTLAPLFGVALFIASNASALASVTVSSTDFGFDLPGTPDAVVNFDSPLPTGIYLTGGMVQNGNNGFGAEPAIATGIKETTNYLSANPGDTALLQSFTGYNSVSVYWGSIDGYNTISLLDSLGNAFASYTGGDITSPANGDQFSANNNRRVTFTISGDTSAIYGLEFQSSAPAFEVDNIGFYGPVTDTTTAGPDGGPAVPEPATWAMMLIGFGMVGAALRIRPNTTLGNQHMEFC
jgi:hypothetical protein